MRKIFNLDEIDTNLCDNCNKTFNHNIEYSEKYQLRLCNECIEDTELENFNTRLNQYLNNLINHESIN